MGNHIRDIEQGLSIHYSIDCNIACQYCYIEKHKEKMVKYNNEKIRVALKNGDFLKHINNYYNTPELKERVNTLALWGAEPTINGDLFNDFIMSFLPLYPNVKEIIFSTNALLGGKKIFQDFCQPLITYCEKEHRELSLGVQFSIDGPEWVNDKSRYKGATKNSIAAIEELSNIYKQKY